MTDRDDEDVDPAPSEDQKDAAPPSGTNQTLWVGLFLILGLIALLAALFVLTDAAIFRGRIVVSTQVADAGGIRRGDPVQMKGVNIGRVQRFKLDKDQVEISLEIEGEYPVPKDSRVFLKSTGPLGGMTANILPGSSSERLRTGDVLPGESEEAMMSVINRISTQAEGVLKRVELVLSDPNIESFSATTRNLEAGSGQMRKLVADMNVAINDQRRELATLTASLQRSAEGFEKVAAGPEIPRTVQRIDALAAKFEPVVSSLEKSSASLEVVMGRLERGEGTAGKLLRDEELFRNMNAAMLNINQATVNINKLSEEIRRDPKKYLKLEVF